MKIDVLGTKYTIRRVDYGKDKNIEHNDWVGYCGEITKEIVILNLRTSPAWEKETDEVITKKEKETLRHELIHAFLNESGLSWSSLTPSAWAKNEEMVDWLAIQFPKIMAAFTKCDCLD